MGKVRGLVAGAAGGLLGAALMGLSYKMVARIAPPAPSGGEDATAKAANAIAKGFTGRGLRPSQKEIGSQFVHYGFGATVGALYGLVAGELPLASVGYGTLFGAMVYAGAHTIAVPAAGLAPSPLRHKPLQESPEFISHLVYGFAADMVRRLLT